MEVGQDGFTINTKRGDVHMYQYVGTRCMENSFKSLNRIDLLGTPMYLLTMYKRSNVRIDGIHSLPI